MRIVYCGGHSILEFDEVKLLASLGHEVFSIGAYIHPMRPLDDKRPPLDIPEIPELIAAVDALGQAGHVDTLEAAKVMGLPDAILDWAEVIIYAAAEHKWLQPNWERLRHKRVIWRTIGQSAHPNEWLMRPLRAQGLEIVRYSPKERRIPEFAGEDALIRFYKDPDEWTGWHGTDPVVTNISQNLYMRSMADDGFLQPIGKQWTSYSYWAAATQGLQVAPAGPGSERIGGLGPISPEAMKELLRRCRVYVNCGTQPSSYTLAFIEAAMTGIPIVSVTPEWMGILPYGHLMFEAHELSVNSASNPEDARQIIIAMLSDHRMAMERAEQQRKIAIENFGMAKIGQQWQQFLEGKEATAPVQWAEAVA